MYWIVGGLLLLYLLTRGAREGFPMLIKDDSVRLDNNIEPEMLPVLEAVQVVFARHDLNPVLTDYRRDDPGSLHARGLAMDFRLFDVAMNRRNTIGFEISRLLGPAYQVIREEGTFRWVWRAGALESSRADAAHAQIHLHIEFDPA